MSSTTGQYHDYSALDAPDHLMSILHYFFTSDKNSYKYTKAKLRYNEICNKREFATAKNLFDILTGTELVNNKTVTTYKSVQNNNIW